MKKKTLKCPYCEDELDHILEWNTISRGTPMTWDGNYDYDNTELSDSSEFEDYTCPSCGESLFVEYGKKDNIVSKLTKTV